MLLWIVSCIINLLRINTENDGLRQHDLIRKISSDVEKREEKRQTGKEIDENTN